MARSFNGTSDKIGLPATLAVPTLNTVVGWIYQATGSSIYILAGTEGNGYLEFGKNGSDKLFINREQVTAIASSTGTIANNTWTHAAVTLDVTSVITPPYAFYINGSVSGSGNGATIAPFTTRTPQIGNSFADGFTSGRQADWAWWNVLLTANEIAALARGERPYNIRPKSLLAYLPIDGLASPESDLSGNARNGTLTGTTSVTGPPMTMLTPRWPSNALISAGPTPPVIYAFDQVGAHITRKITSLGY